MRTRFFWLFCALSGAAAAAPLTFQSGPNRVALVELYTSEGCSSCPPADRWLGMLRDHPGLWHDFVPIAFHVSYWDQLGWKDRLASRTFTGRQYAYAQSWGTKQVYTPCFVFNGDEWEMSINALRPANEPPAGVLTLEAPAPNALSHCTVRFDRPGKKLLAHVALLGGGITTQIKGGENTGLAMTHEFAVLAVGEGEFAGTTAAVILPAPLVKAPPRTALVAWVSAGDSLAPLQAVGGWVAQ